MPRMQVYLPQDLYNEVKQRGLRASELLQEAIRVELRRREIDEETDRYLAEIREELGEPTAEDIAEAEELVSRILEHRRSRQVS